MASDHAKSTPLSLIQNVARDHPIGGDNFFRFPRPLRIVEDLLRERGIEISLETRTIFHWTDSGRYLRHRSVETASGRCAPLPLGIAFWRGFREEKRRDWLSIAEQPIRGFATPDSTVGTSHASVPADAKYTENRICSFIGPQSFQTRAPNLLTRQLQT